MVAKVAGGRWQWRGGESPNVIDGRGSNSDVGGLFLLLVAVAVALAVAVDVAVAVAAAAPRLPSTRLTAWARGPT